jgi:hypothetical protein
MTLPLFTSHESLMLAFVYTANKGPSRPIEGAFENMKHLWFFINSDKAWFNGKEVEKGKRPLFVNPVLVGSPDFTKYFEAGIDFCCTRRGVELKEIDCVNELIIWIDQKKTKEKASERQRKLEEFKDFLTARLVINHLAEDKESTIPIQIKPRIGDETANSLFEILRESFEDSQHSELISLFKTGDDVKQKLVFKGAANRLTDVFKRLIEANLLGGCNKKDLQNWIIANFQYLRKGSPSDFNKKTTHKSISGDQYPCKNPVIEIVNGQVQRANSNTR